MQIRIKTASSYMSKSAPLPGVLGKIQKKREEYHKKYPQEKRGRIEITILATIGHLIIMYFVIQAEAAKHAFIRSGGDFLTQYLFYMSHHPFPVPPLTLSMLLMFLLKKHLYIFGSKMRNLRVFCSKNICTLTWRILTRGPDEAGPFHRVHSIS